LKLFCFSFISIVRTVLLVLAGFNNLVARK